MDADSWQQVALVALNVVQTCFLTWLAVTSERTKRDVREVLNGEQNNHSARRAGS